jgi:hypothetical protein
VYVGLVRLWTGENRPSGRLRSLDRRLRQSFAVKKTRMRSTIARNRLAGADETPGRRFLFKHHRCVDVKFTAASDVFFDNTRSIAGPRWRDSMLMHGVPEHIRSLLS